MNSNRAEPNFGRPQLGEPICSPAERAKAVHRFKVSGATVSPISGEAEQAQDFMAELQVLHRHAQLLGEQLGMSRITHGITSHENHTLAFRFYEGLQEGEDVLGLTAERQLRCSEAMDQLQGLEA